MIILRSKGIKSPDHRGLEIQNKDAAKETLTNDCQRQSTIHKQTHPYKKNKRWQLIRLSICLQKLLTMHKASTTTNKNIIQFFYHYDKYGQDASTSQLVNAPAKSSSSFSQEKLFDGDFHVVGISTCISRAVSHLSQNSNFDKKTLHVNMRRA